jgi:hypothetical protein
VCGEVVIGVDDKKSVVKGIRALAAEHASEKGPRQRCVCEIAITDVSGQDSHRAGQP